MRQIERAKTLRRSIDNSGQEVRGLEWRNNTMFNFKTKFFLMASFLVLGGVSAANAQVGDDTALKFNVSHSFIVKDTTLPAGSYTVTRTPSVTDPASFLLIQGDNGKSVIFDTIAAETARASANTQLIFNEVDGNHFLSKILVRGDAVGNSVPPTDYEKKFVAEHKLKSEGVTTEGGSDR
jgi:hypothetical protein